MNKIKRFFECLVPESNCNLKCSYCYLIQSNRRAEKKVNFLFSPEYIGKALTKERLGGICYFSICAIGETLLPKEVLEITYELLKNGHYVNITTNGTLNKRFDEIILFPKEYLKRLHIAFSFHFLELKRIKKLDDFFSNIEKVKKNNISITVQLNLCDDYISHLKEIKEISINKLGTYPQIALTRNQRSKKMTIESIRPMEEYIKLGESFNSPLFRYTVKNFNKKEKHFCYAGDWSGILNLASGELKKCYNYPYSQNIFKNINEKIKFEAIGKVTCKPYCINSSHFLSLGVVPKIKTESYADLRNRKEENWYSKEMEEFLNTKLYDNNKEYDILKKIKVSLKTNILQKINIFHKILNKIIKD